MTWDFPEVNPFAGAARDFGQTAESMSRSVGTLAGTGKGVARQLDATAPGAYQASVIVITDRPYYDNIDYADLSDFFYVWQRKCLGTIHPDLFSTLLTPKAQELVATPYRFDGNKDRARSFFERGLQQVFGRVCQAQHTGYPLAIYYAFKQSESEENDENNEESPAWSASTGWETMLEALVRSGLSIAGTWPMRTERPTGVKVTFNALASSIVLVCRPRLTTAPLAPRREFLNKLKAELPLALKNLQRGNIAPVDLAQAAIGPGMAVFSSYSKVVEADGSPMTVRTALALINQTLDEVLAEQEGEFDSDTR
ncbi:MAG: hypothetical protein M1423_01105 [Acidobacteria bacterium]|nr:hypothetical protein [Acidobacteriota bacterium]